MVLVYLRVLILHIKDTFITTIKGDSNPIDNYILSERAL